MGVHLNGGQLGPSYFQSLPRDASLGGGGTSEFMSTGPKLVPIMIMRWLYWGVCLRSGQPDPS